MGRSMPLVSIIITRSRSFGSTGTRAPTIIGPSSGTRSNGGFAPAKDSGRISFAATIVKRSPANTTNAGRACAITHRP